MYIVTMMILITIIIIIIIIIICYLHHEGTRGDEILSQVFKGFKSESMGQGHPTTVFWEMI